MAKEIEPTRSRPPIVKRALAGVVLIVIAYLAIHVVIGLVMTVFWIVAVVAVIAAAIWALNAVL